MCPCPIKYTPFFFVAPRNAAGRLSGTIRKLAQFRLQIADPLLPCIVITPLFVRQADIGVEFQCLDLLSEKVDKLSLEIFDRLFHTAFSNATVSENLGRRGAKLGCLKARESCREWATSFGLAG